MTTILRLAKVLDVMGMSRSTLYLRVKQGLMTPPVKLGERSAAWPEHEVSAINAARISQKSEEEIRELVVWLNRRRAESA